MTRGGKLPFQLANLDRSDLRARGEAAVSNAPLFKALGLPFSKFRVFGVGYAPVQGFLFRFFVLLLP